MKTNFSTTKLRGQQPPAAAATPEVSSKLKNSIFVRDNNKFFQKTEP